MVTFLYIFEIPISAGRIDLIDPLIPLLSVRVLQMLGQSSGQDKTSQS